jgi:hypothetical protein
VENQSFSEGKEAVLFLKKKNQKDFYESGPRALQNPGSEAAAFFLLP